MLGYGLGLLAFFGSTFLRSGTGRGEQKEIGLLRCKDTINHGARLLEQSAAPFCWYGDGECGTISRIAMQKHRRNHAMLGLGTQIKGHNARRFSVPWVPPRPRLRDIVLAIRAI